MRRITPGRRVQKSAPWRTAWYAEIDHGGVLVRYANLSMLYAIRAGDPVRAGQTIGFIGRTMPEECDLPAHLHLRIVVGGTAIDPEKVLQNGAFPSP